MMQQDDTVEVELLVGEKGMPLPNCLVVIVSTTVGSTELLYLYDMLLAKKQRVGVDMIVTGINVSNAVFLPGNPANSNAAMKAARIFAGAGSMQHLKQLARDNKVRIAKLDSTVQVDCD